MKVIYYISLLLVLSPVFTANWPMPTTNCSAVATGQVQPASTHYGGCIMLKAYGTAQTNLRSVDAKATTLSSANVCINSARKYLMVNGLLLTGQLTCDTSIDDKIFAWVAKATQEMLTYDANTTCDGYHQCLAMQKMYEYRATTVLLKNSNSTCMKGVSANWSMCDIIMKDQSTVNKQINEVVEHIIHAVTDVGLYRAMPSVFGFETTSLLYAAYTEAVTNKLFVTTSYTFPEPGNTRIKIQEYVYLLFSQCAGLFKTYGNPHTGEWVPGDFTCDGATKTKNPKGYWLYKDVLSKIIKLPSTATMTALGKIASGQTVPAAPTLTDGTTSDSVCKCTCSTGCCSDTPFGNKATYGTAPTGLKDKTHTKCASSSLIALKMSLQVIAIIALAMWY